MRDAMDGNRQILADKEHAVSIDMPKAPVIAEVDCTRVAQVLGNLVNNAAKLSPTSHATQVNIDPTPR